MNDLKQYVDKMYYKHLETIYNIQDTQEAYKESYGTEWIHYFKRCKEYINLMIKLKSYNEEIHELYQAVIYQIIKKHTADIPDSCTSKFQKIQYLFKNNIITLDNVEDIIINLIVKL
jgi:hypothetical protein